MTNSELVFHKSLGAIVANKISVEYNGYIAEIYKENKMNHLANKCSQAATAEQKVIDSLRIKLKSVAKELDDIVELNSNMIHDLTLLDPEHQ